jgi:hypothetical protein
MKTVIGSSGSELSKHIYMNTRVLFILFFLSRITVSVAQNVKLPDQPFRVVIGKDTLETKTVIVKNPIINSSDTLRRETTLFSRNEKYRIWYPPRLDTIYRNRPEPPYEVYEEVITTDHIDITELVDSISIDELENKLHSEIKINESAKEYRTTDVTVWLIWRDGRSHHYDRMSFNDRLSEDIKTLSSGAYCIFDSIWFIDSANHINKIEGTVGWKIK